MTEETIRYGGAPGGEMGGGAVRMPRARLFPVASYRHNAVGVLYQHLTERMQDPHLNISHTQMPSRRKHAAFIRSKPYRAWYIIEPAPLEHTISTGLVAGNCYLTKADELGIYLSPGWRGAGLARQAMEQLMHLHPRKRYLANINPANERSILFFKRVLGAEPLQITLQIRRTT